MVLLEAHLAGSSSGDSLTVVVAREGKRGTVEDTALGNMEWRVIVLGVSFPRKSSLSSSGSSK